MLDGRDPQWGLVGDGQTDDTPALQSLVNAAGGSPQRVLMPPGVFRLFSPVHAAGSVELAGEGPERTIITPPPDSPAIVIGSTEVSGPHGVRLTDMTFRHNGWVDTPYPMVDVIQYGRKWTIERVHFDGCFSNRPGLRLETSWVGSVRDCNWWKFGTEGQPGQRAAVIVAPTKLGGGQGPINNVAFTDCAWERCQVGVDLHDPDDLDDSSALYCLAFRNPRFKNTSTAGPTPNSVGIRANSNQTFAVSVEAPFFEDFATGMSVRGWGWVVTSPFGQSADVVVDLVSGGGHQIQSMVLQGSANNRVGVGVWARPGVSRKCAATYPTSVTGATYMDHLVVDESGGKLSVTAA